MTGPEKCARCGGSGTVEKDGKLYECQCAFMRRMAASMPRYVKMANVERKHVDHPVIGKTGESLLLTVSWEDMKAFLKVLYLRFPTKFLKITSDLEIIDVYLGKRSKASKSDDYVGEIYGSLHDLVFHPDLLIVRLNKLSYKNKAASGALEEALSYRMDYDRPTWAVSDPRSPFSQGSFAYSESVWDLMDSCMGREAVPPINRAVSAPDVAPVVHLDPVATRGRDPGSGKAPRAAKKVRSVPDDEPAAPGLGMYGSGIPVKGKNKSFGRDD